MISIQTAAQGDELVALAREIAHDAGLDMRAAFALACQELPALLAEAQADARFVPARVVMFDAAGQPCRVPNLLSAEELIAFTGGDRDVQ